ncbi:hypothetical protein JR316_0012936 [Psilocybe cubensis]|uniref:Uncharacterized protein n=1 Tax=Psilocybe cubensis TaxID=181762 RepID=A0ACB8GG01_PSICU|nr:hypothetical protein JR316_0012936 [Psilocybe cubensis]KAH9474477.1 hypothetical protein JR316_0012936 [Psilocybe cubensis]
MPLFHRKATVSYRPVNSGKRRRKNKDRLIKKLLNLRDVVQELADAQDSLKKYIKQRHGIINDTYNLSLPQFQTIFTRIAPYKLQLKRTKAMENLAERLRAKLVHAHKALWLYDQGVQSIDEYLQLPSGFKPVY